MNSTSNRKLKVTVNGKSYMVEVGSLHTSPIRVTVNGQSYQVELGEAGFAPGPDPHTMTGDTISAPARPEPVSVGAADDHSQATETNNRVTAPMPGHIIEIAVKPGEQVDRGQALCALEAMKMKNTIRSPQAGVIAIIEVTEGQIVAHGDVLFTFA